MKKVFKHLELFAGIGGFRRAIDLYCKDNNLTSECDFPKLTSMHSVYKSNYDTSNELEIGDISEFVSCVNNINSIPSFDLLTGGFPCQPFSMMGENGLEDKRGNLFYSIIDILMIKKPKYALLENVRNIKNHDKGKTYNEIIRS